MPVFVSPVQPGAIQYYVDGETGNTCLSRGMSHSVTYTMAAVAGAASYTWTFPEAWNAGAITTNGLSATVITDTNSAGVVTVTANGGAGCNSAVRTLSVVRSGLEFCVAVLPVSSKYKFYIIDDSNIGNGTAVYYRWYNGSALLTEAADANACAVPENAEVVRVEVTDSNGCVTVFEMPGSTPAGSTVCNDDTQVVPAQRSAAASRMAAAGREGIQTLSDQAALKLFPNPASDEVTITLPVGVRQADLLIYTVTGTQIASIKGVTENTMLNVREYESGTYYVVVSSEDGIYRSRFMVSH